MKYSENYTDFNNRSPDLFPNLSFPVPNSILDKPAEGVKHDKEKVRYDLLPPELLEGVAQILTFGAKKYGDRNWELGMDWMRVFGALQRHLWAWRSGEDVDPETSKSHLWHAGCCIAFLMAYEARKTGTDNR